MSIIPVPSNWRMENIVLLIQPEHLAVKLKTGAQLLSANRSSEKYLCQLDANETKPFWDGKDRFNFFPLLQIFAMTEWHALVQPLKQKNDWQSNEGQIVFQPADTVSNQLNTSHKMVTKSLALKTVGGYLSRDNLPHFLCPQNTLKENFPVGGFTSSQGPALSFVCSWNNLTFILLCWRFLILFTIVGSGFISHQCHCAPGN